MSGLVKYHLQQYWKKNKYVMPLVALLIALYGLYSVKPADFIDCLSVSGMFVFLVMVWVGVTTCDQEDMVSEQILILRVQSFGKYHLSHVLFQLVLSAAAGFWAIMVPVVQNFVNSKQFFDRPIRASDILGGFVLLFLCAFAGSALGELSHPEIIKNRKTAVVFVLLLAILSLAKGAITEGFPVMKPIFWILPPIWELSCILSGTEYFSVQKIVTSGGMLFLSGTFLTIIKMCLVKRQHR